MQIEDQVWPKRCGHMLGKQIIPKEEMIGKIKACVKARNEENPDFVITARTDARGIAGLDEAINRGQSYAKAGADCIYVESPQSLEEVELLVKRIPAPVAFNMIEGGRTPPFKLDELEHTGVRIVSFALTCLFAATKAMLDVLTLLKTTRDYTKYSEKVLSWNDFNEIIGLPEMRKMEFELFSRDDLIAAYGTDNIDQITRQEREGTEKVWRKASREC